MTLKLGKIIILILGIFFSFPLFAQESSPSLTVITNQQINFRAGPSTDWNVIAVIAPNVSLIVTARTSNFDWLLTDYQGQQGWIASWLVLWEGGDEVIQALPVIEVAPPPEPYVPPSVTTQDFSVLREGPGVNFARLTVVPPDVALAPIGRSENYEWYQVEYEGQRGWIIYWLLAWTGSIETLPIDGIDPVPFIRIADLPNVPLVPIDRYTRFRNRINREITAGLTSLRLVENAWIELDRLGSTECVTIENVGFRALPEALLQDEVVYFPLLTALQNAFNETNAAIALLEDICSRAEGIVTPREITQALDQIEEARRNYTLATALINGLHE